MGAIASAARSHHRSRSRVSGVHLDVRTRNSKSYLKKLERAGAVRRTRGLRNRRRSEFAVPEHHCTFAHQQLESLYCVLRAVRALAI
jgi:hypothetical protein